MKQNVFLLKKNRVKDFNAIFGLLSIAAINKIQRDKSHDKEQTCKSVSETVASHCWRLREELLITAPLTANHHQHHHKAV